MSLKRSHRIVFIFIIYITFFSKLNSFDRSFFYRASSFWDEVRFEIPSLSTLNIQLSGGSTRVGKNPCGKTTSIFGIYGPEKVDDDVFVFTGTFDIFEANFNLYQNITKGFFLHFHLPVVSLQIFPISCNQSFFSSFNQEKFSELNKFLNERCLFLSPIKERGLSDSTLFLGWSLNYENTKYLDFIDFSLQTGVLFPTGKKTNNFFLFDIPLGYNGFWGIPWVIDFSIGAFEWLTWGLHNDGVVFFDRDKCLSISQEKCATGLLRLIDTKAKVKSGPVWRVGSYLKADHFCWGLSLIMALTYEQKNRNHILCLYDKKFNLNTANQDERFKQWDRLIYQFLFEYDFTKDQNNYGNRVAFLYNHQIFGKRVFSTNIIGGYIGFDILWCF